VHKTAYYKRKENNAYINVNVNSFSKGQANYHYKYNKLNNIINGEVVSMNKHQGMKAIKTKYHIIDYALFIFFEIGKHKDDEQHKRKYYPYNKGVKNIRLFLYKKIAKQ